jgi:phytoene desaturase
VYTRLVAARHRRWNSDFLVRQKKLSMGLFVGYFGARGTWPELAHHSIMLGPRYRELLEDIFERKILADDFSLYLHAPTRTDPSLAPPGHEAFYVLSPVPNTQGKIDWDAVGPRYFDAILERSSSATSPACASRIVTKRHITPNYFETTLRSVGGAAFGPEPRLRQSAFFRYHNRSEDVERPLLRRRRHPPRAQACPACSRRPRCSSACSRPAREPRLLTMPTCPPGQPAARTRRTDLPPGPG